MTRRQLNRVKFSTLGKQCGRPKEVRQTGRQTDRDTHRQAGRQAGRFAPRFGSFVEKPGPVRFGVVISEPLRFAKSGILPVRG